MIGRTNAGGGGTGGTLTVNAPAGVTVIATNSTTNRTYTRTANSDGIAVFKGLATGTYLVHITDGTTTSDNFTATVVADYELTVKFFAAYINVTYPAGSTCTCSDGSTTFTATSTSGSYQFVVPNTGTWTVNCTDGSQSASASVSITADEQTKSVALSYFAATINVTFPAGSTCTCSNGSTVYTAGNTSGSWTFTITTAGTWTVSCTKGTDTDTATVSITAAGQTENVTLAYKLWIFKAGQGDVTPLTIWNEKYISISKNSDNIRLWNNNSDTNNRYFGIYTTDKIDLTPYTKLRMTANFTEVYNTRFGVRTTVPNSVWSVDYSCVAEMRPTTGAQTHTLDITDVNQMLYCTLTGTGAGSTVCTQGTITNIWLEK